MNVRMAFMLVAADGEVAKLGKALRKRRGALQSALPHGAHLRLGLRPETDTGDGAGRAFPVTDAAIEATVAAADAGTLSEIAAIWRKAVGEAIDPRHCCAMVGQCHEIISPRPGEVFYSLTFRRDPLLNVDQFRKWWLDKHGPLASELLHDDLLGYDQVHVDDDQSHKISEAAGFDWPGYDAYDNLTWASVGTYLKMAEKADAMQALYEDELGHVDHSTYKGALLTLI